MTAKLLPFRLLAVQNDKFGIDRRAFISGVATLTAIALVPACRSDEDLETSVDQALTGTFTGRLGLQTSQLGNIALGAP